MHLSCSSKFSIKTIVIFIQRLEPESAIEKISGYFKIPLKVNVLGFIFSNIAGLHLQSLLRNKHLLRYVFKTPIFIAPLSLKNMWCLLKWYG